MTELRKLYIADESTGRTANIDGSTDSLQIITHEHHMTNAGYHFFVSSYADLATDEVLDFTWQMPDTTRWTHWEFAIDTEDELNWLVYEDAVATNPLANTFTPLNSNRNSLTASGTTLKYEVQADLATANADTAIGGATTLMSGITKAGSKFTPGGGASGNPNEVVFKQGALYCLRAIATAAGYINFTMTWYEHPDFS